MRRDEILVELDGVDCIVGIYPEERTREQPVRVRLALWLDLEACARTGDLAATVDYAGVAAGVERLLREGKFELLESAAAAILRSVLAPANGPRPLGARVSLTKLLALGGKARATVTMER